MSSQICHVLHWITSWKRWAVAEWLNVELATRAEKRFAYKSILHKLSKDVLLVSENFLKTRCTEKACLTLKKRLQVAGFNKYFDCLQYFMPSLVEGHVQLFPSNRADRTRKDQVKESGHGYLRAGRVRRLRESGDRLSSPLIMPCKQTFQACMVS